MALYRLTKIKLFDHATKKVKPIGSVVDLTDAQVKVYAHGIEPWHQGLPTPVPAVLPEPAQITATEADSDSFDTSILDGNLASVREFVSSLDDPTYLDVLYEAEKEGKDRSGVLSAIEARKTDLLS